MTPRSVVPSGQPTMQRAPRRLVLVLDQIVGEWWPGYSRQCARCLSGWLYVVWPAAPVRGWLVCAQCDYSPAVDVVNKAPPTFQPASIACTGCGRLRSELLPRCEHCHKRAYMTARRARLRQEAG